MWRFIAKLFGRPREPVPDGRTEGVTEAPSPSSESSGTPEDSPVPGTPDPAFVPAAPAGSTEPHKPPRPLYPLPVPSRNGTHTHH